MENLSKTRPEPIISENAMRVLEKRYLLRNEKGEVIETPKEMYERVAKAIAEIDKDYPVFKEKVSETEEKFYYIMSQGYFLPNSPTLMNAGTKMGQLSACFVLPVEDSMEGIFETLKHAAIIHKTGGGCIIQGSKVFTSRCGLENIETLWREFKNRKIYKKDNGKYINIEKENIYTFSLNPDTGEFEKDKITHIWEFDLKGKEIYKIETENGIKITTSSWHPFFVFEKGKIIQKRAEEIKEGDFLILPNLSIKEKWFFNKEKEVEGIKIDEEIGWLIGYFTGDGSLGKFRNKLRLRFHDSNRELIEKAKEILTKRFKTKVNSLYEDKRSISNYTISTTDQNAILKFINIAEIEPGEKSSTVKIPKVIIKSPLEVVLSFIAGLLDSDGYVSKKRPRLTLNTASKNLAEEVTCILNLAGIKTNIRERIPRKRKWRKMYEVKIDGYSNLKLFYKIVGNYIKDKRKIERIKNNLKREPASSGYYIPIDFKDFEPVLKKIGIKTSGTEIWRHPVEIGGEKFWLHRWKQGFGIERYKFKRLLKAILREKIDKDTKKQVEKYLHITEYVTRVKTVEKEKGGNKKFYDFTVEKNNNYLSGKFGLTVIHNTGFSFSRLRPKGDVVRTTGQIASGPVSFMKVFDAATEAVKQGGRRRGANMGILKINHPDIEEFITCKDDVTQITNFNISVAVTDEFMEALKRGDKEFPLINPRNGEVMRKVNPREIWEKLVYQAWKNGEPGVIFIDRINKTHTLKGVGEIEATNPCVSGDTWIITPEGPYKVKEIVGRFTKIALNGKFHSTTEDGFFKTGEKDVFRIKTKKGYEIKVTKDHLVRAVERITRYKIYETWKPAGELKPGDKIILSNNRKIYWKGRGNFEEGYLLGLLIGDGTLKKDAGIIGVWGENEGAESVMAEAKKAALSLPHRKDFKGFTKISNTEEHRLKLASLRDLAKEYGILPGKKTLTEKIEKTSYEFYRGFLRGIFDADGTVIGNHKKGISIRLWQKDLNTLKIVQRMLLRMGIVSSLYISRKKEGDKLLPDGKGGYKLYHVKEGHELVISKDNLRVFFEKIGFSDIEKRKKLETLLKSYKRTLNRERFVDEIEKIEYVGKEDVYDVQIPGINAFDANGFYVHNCGEKPLLPYESCNLGSINVAKFYKGTPWYLENKRIASWEEVKDRIDWEKMKEIVELAVHFLDNVIDANVYPLPEIERMTKLNRKIGLGVMGFADLLYMLGIPYSSPSALKAAEEIMKFIQENAHRKSIEIGEIKGPFPNIEKSIFKGTKRRNSVVTTIAPTGTISMIADTSPGIEPNFALVYVKNVMGGERLLYVNKYLRQAAEGLGFYSEELMEALSKMPTIKKIDEIPEHIRKIFDVTFDVPTEQHVRIQAAFQKYVEDAVSKTINLPESATPKDIEEAYLLAYELGCKGITVYRHGSRPGQVYDTAKKEEEKRPKKLKPRPRPKVVSGRTYKIKSELGTVYITINEDEYGPHEVFIQLGKSGSSANALTEAIGRLISLALRSGIDPMEIVDQLKGIRSMPTWDDGEVILSCPDGIGKVLEKHLKGEQLGIFPEDKKEKRVIYEAEYENTNHSSRGEICPECGGVMVHAEDCLTCPHCGFSKCD